MVPCLFDLVSLFASPGSPFADVVSGLLVRLLVVVWCHFRQRAVAEEVRLVNPVRHGLGLQTEIQQLRRDLQAFLNEQEVRCEVNEQELTKQKWETRREDMWWTDVHLYIFSASTLLVVDVASWLESEYPDHSTLDD